VDSDAAARVPDSGADAESGQVDQGGAETEEADYGAFLQGYCAEPQWGGGGCEWQCLIAGVFFTFHLSSFIWYVVFYVQKRVGGFFGPDFGRIEIQQGSIPSSL
jgi:hypothetical protein